MKSNEETILKEGRFLLLKERNGWEYAVRRNASGVVVILPITDEGMIVLIEQFRAPVNQLVIELPAGLAGDIEGAEEEDFIEAAHRELLEETGYAAAHMEFMGEGPSSAGLTTEMISFYLAKQLTRVADGGGDETESIVMYEVAPSDLNNWLRQRQREGCLIDYKIYAALYLMQTAEG